MRHKDMGLQDYEKKRDLYRSGEPAARIQTWEQQLRFVIQKHQASHLHYDLRLELEGVLKSWAVPKGPSLDPSQKKLAIMVEDHPIEYRNFEGVIPEGNYGAGTVMIWDEGSYFIPNTNSKTESEQMLKHSIIKGHILFFLQGKKLKGEFLLVKLNRSSLNNGWFLIKKHDRYATSLPVLNDDISVRSSRNMSQISIGGSSGSLLQNINLGSLNLSGAKKSAFPKGPVHPMLAQLVASPFDNKEWIFEIKWDGYRAITETRHNYLQFYSRKGISFLNDYYPVVSDLKKISFEAVFDGELVVVDSEGRADFGLLQNYKRTQNGVLLYYIFDLLFLEGYDLRNNPLIQRKNILKQILPALDHLRYNDHIEQDGVAFYQLAKENRIEGIMAKDKSSPYLEGVRSNYWQKIKITMQQEFVIGGFTEPRGGRTGFGALLLGVYDNNQLIFVGSVGVGFSNYELPQIRKHLEEISSINCPFKNVPGLDSKITWIDPSIICEVKFAEWTAEGILRLPVFIGFREDLNPLEIHRENVYSTSLSKPYYIRNPSDDKTINIKGNTLKLTNLSKVYFPSDNITKGEVIDYYRNISLIILPYLEDRPQSLHRFPDGIYGKEFFHKNMEDVPEWMPTASIVSDGSIIRYILCQNEATLTYMVNLGSIEINPWNSRINSIDFPDYIVIDLDPFDCPFQYVIDAALVAHEILQNIDIPHYIKTSGATGLHLFIPAGARYSYEQVRQFSLIVCTLINNKLPEITSLERVPQKRHGRVYLDFLQNSKGKTMAAPYSIRPRQGATVSTPLLWEELNYQLIPEQFNIHSIFARLGSYGDLWKPVIGKGIDMLYFLDRLSSLF